MADQVEKSDICSNYNTPFGCSDHGKLCPHIKKSLIGGRYRCELTELSLTVGTNFATRPTEEKRTRITYEIPGGRYDL